MYNGIGLQTARGSGTSGHVQENKFSDRRRRSGVGNRDWRSGASRAEPSIRRKPNEDLLEHERKRKIEVELFKLRDDLEDEGKHSEEEIEKRVGELRAKLEAAAAQGGGRRERGRGRFDVPQDTHAVADRKAKQMRNLARALRVDPELKEGQAFDRELQEQKKQEMLEERDKFRMEAEARSEKRRREREERTKGGRKDGGEGEAGTKARGRSPPAARKKRSRRDRSPSASYSYYSDSYSYSYSDSEGDEEAGKKSPPPRQARGRSGSYSSYSYSYSPSR
ncbi:cwf21 domain-containing protein [Chloropicon primus]|uniref:CWF21 domain-containing protein n=1 Tax=Chloropicon primus TaxID=1764295 RepID=A0A5B8MV57_9CHLO|nr:hypothetical protein A3770_10p59000 [Chloropicon primus]UPR02594.1 cwf21 domain-containing protein [Chloropicon primus]|mmetsp:Transcript_14606/g.41705  ORF Transcript_14606/g.41705 Transcript_14606/m.41705 type:complete len:279 (-) Transcript_14606:797-1633(-)|eukprot:QDZ23382.1 hypothetical protein A3770_10p59000 [Chloropicon primus]